MSRVGCKSAIIIQSPGLAALATVGACISKGLESATGLKLPWHDAHMGTVLPSLGNATLEQDLEECRVGQCNMAVACLEVTNQIRYPDK